MLKNRVYRACVAASSIAERPAPLLHQVKFLFSRLQELVPTNNDCYLSACNGSFCIIDRYRPAVAGSRVLIDIAGRYEWASVGGNPARIVTEEGIIFEGNRLQEVVIVGVVIRKVVPLYQRPSPVPVPV